jgi:hypothetical protein
MGNFGRLASMTELRERSNLPHVVWAPNTAFKGVCLSLDRAHLPPFVLDRLVC